MLSLLPQSEIQYGALYTPEDPHPIQGPKLNSSVTDSMGLVSLQKSTKLQKASVKFIWA